MAVAAIVLPIISLLFILSGLIVNLIQAICFILLRPLSKNMYRRVNMAVTESLWLELIWMIDWWAGIKIHFYADSETFQSLGKEHALLVCNHRGDIDWLVGWVIAQRSGCISSSLAVMKKSLKFLPVIGWAMWFSEFVFLERSWAKDENTLRSGFQQLKDFPRPLWLALYVEGTRFTKAKLLAAQEYAASKGLPIPRNVLIPRTKGLVSAVSNMRSFVPAVYDLTVVVPKSQPDPTILRIIKGQSSTVHIRMKRYSMTELPQTDDGVAQWCKDLYVEKDSLIDKHLDEKNLDENELRPIGHPKKSLLAVVAWSCLLMFGAFKFLKWSELLSTWEGVAISTAVLLLVTGVMHILIINSQAERTTPQIVALNGLNKKDTYLNANHKKLS
ncbi:1-acyl-sn-glycerol-3-phosphate acyltransferase PLS1-like protein [Cinnamomum micranthum f. kanehirae]|uniref:1-acylglycerol-3-phosphate O-acyltransferase n=1 Tax=Cinnamomum micranthum f. kanehirae TaxID=337451 RepID=A0A443N2E5_9MAGN|nr:1-acyl-sn-glycerol-3-phosphate acyltransferase PLS1-like protein [Cinnamomum micranthum f. kanehirae]